ncbi:Outer membrane autotransporter barrel domain (modular protein) [Mesorhizobium sp. ORS 3359]|nr:Outer membrane autotransporter barrel domain (modular protein) [Mesorhizobium sp. ORS 3359]
MAGLACGGTIHDYMENGEATRDRRLQADGRHSERASSQARSGRHGRRPELARRPDFFQLLRGGRMTKWKGEAASCAPHVAQPVLAVSRAWAGRLMVAAAIAALSASSAAAADRYWDVNGTSAGTGGTGAWNTTASNLVWSPNGDGVSGPYTFWNNAGVDNAIFGGTAGTVTIGAPITAHTLTFTTSGYTLNGGTLTLAGSTPGFVNNFGVTTTINSVIAGTAGLDRSGTGGTLILNGANTFSGGITMNGTALQFNGDAALGSASNNITISAAGAALTNTGSTDINAARTVTIGAGILTINQTGAGNVGSARFSGAGGLTVGSAGTRLTNNASDYTGQTTFGLLNNNATNGQMFFSSIGNVGGGPSALGAPITVANGTIAVNGSANGQTEVVYTGAAASSDRNWILSPGFFGEPIIRNQGTGTLTLSGAISLAGGGNATGYGFWADTADLLLSGTVSSAGDRPIAFTGSSTARTITVTGSNTFTGGVTIGAGPIGGGAVTLKVNSLANTGSASALGTGTGGSITIQSGSVLSYTGTGATSNRVWVVDGDGTIRSDGSGALSLSGAVTFTSGGPAENFTLSGNFAGTNTLSGAISGTGSLLSDAASTTTWVVTGSNSYSGSTIVNGGTLRAGSSQAFGPATNTVVVNGGTLDLGGFDLTTSSLSGTGGTVALGTSNLTVNGTSSTSFAGSLTGAGGITKGGTGSLTLSGTNSYTGATTVNGGTLALNFAAAGAPATNILSSSSGLVMSGGTLTVTGKSGIANLQTFSGMTATTGTSTISATSGSGGSMTLNLGAVGSSGGLVNFVLPTSGSITTTSPDGTLGWATVNNSDYAQVVGGNITAFTSYTNQDNASLWTNGQVISDAGGAANSAYFGTVGSSIQIGGLKYTAANASTVTIGAGATLGISGTIIVAPSVGANSDTITGGSITGPAGGGTLGVLQNSTGTFTIASTIVDNGGAVGFTKAGTGTVTLTGVNTYTGPTTISGGQLNVTTIGNGGVASNIGASSSAASNLVLQNGVLNYTGGTATTDRGFTLVNGGPSRSISVSGGANLTFTGIVTSPDDAGFTKIGNGTLTLANAANDYVGATVISTGTLSVGTLADGGLASGIGASSSNAANLVISSAANLQYTGASTSSNRSFTLGAGVTGGGIDVSNAATTLTMSGQATGVGSILRKEGAGALLLSGLSTYTGGTIVNAGTLRAGSTQAFGGSDSNGTGVGSMTVNAGGTLDLNNLNNTVGGLNGGGSVTLGGATLRINNNSTGAGFTGVISGTGGVTIAAGTQVMNTGCGNTYTGVTTITSTLSVSCLANGGSPSDIGMSSSASSNLVFGGSGQLVYTGASVAIDRGMTLAGGNFIQVTNAGTVLQIGGTIVDGVTPDALIKTGAGTLVLSGTNTYTGDTTARNGTLRAGSTSAFGTAGGLVIGSGATADLAGFNTSVRYLGDDSGNPGPGTLALGGATLTISNGLNATYSGAITGAGGLNKSGAAGTETLTGCNSSYTGPTTLGAGTLQVTCLANGGSNSSIGASTSSAANLVLNGGTLQYIGTGGSTDRLFSLGPSATSALDASGTGAIAFTNTGAVAFTTPNTSQTVTLTGSNTGNNSLAAQLTNNGSGTTSLTKSGTGTWILKNSGSTYTGVTNIAGGVLGVDKLTNGGQASSIGQSSSAASNLIIGSGSTLRYTGAGDTTDRLFTLSTGTSFIESSGTGAIVFSNTGSAAYTGSGARTLALGGINTGLNTMGGTIVDGPGGQTTLAKNDSGTWVLTGNNTFTGNTVINGGNLMIGNGGTSGNAGSGNVIITDASSTLSFNRSDTFNFTGTINPDPQAALGTIAQIGTGTTILTATNKVGAARVDAGTLQVNGSLTSAAGITVNAGTLQNIGGGSSITTPTITMNAGSTLNVGGGTVQAAGGTQTLFTGGTGGATINITGGALLGNGTLGGGGNTVNLTAGSLNTGAAALNLGSGNDTFVLSGLATISGAGVDGGGGTDTLQVNVPVSRTLDGTQIAGFESLNKQGSGTLLLTGNHNYSGGVTITTGTLEIGNGVTAGTLTTPTVANSGVLAFNMSSDYTFGATVSGTGRVNKLGAGTTTLTGNNSYAGPTSIIGGALLINGDQSGATGQTSVGNGATLGGMGVIGGNVLVANGGTLSPGAAGSAPGTLTINGGLTLNNTSNLNVNFGQANVPGGPLNDLVNVGGNLTLDGTLNVTQTPGGSFGPGVYRVINYNGSLTDNGLAVTDPNYFVQTSVAHQVNLVNSAGLTLSYWDGDAGPHSNGAVNGGSGTWRAAGDQNWTDATGVFAAPFANASFAIFQGAAGTVTVDGTNGAVQAAGMQFATDGYLVQGADVGLVGPQSIIRVGDGTAGGAAYVATIASNLMGGSQLVKADAGTLVLSGTNSYTGGTAINGGTLQIASNGNLGDASGGLSLDSGRLHTTANVNSTRAVTLNAGGGTFDTDSATGLILNNMVSGAGALTKEGGGTLVLSGANIYQGGTFINDGTVQITADANLGNATGKVTFDGGTLYQQGAASIVTTRVATLQAGGGTFQVDSTVQWEGAIDGAGALTKTGAGALILGADNSYAGGTTIASGLLMLGTGGTTGSIVGNVVDNGALSFNRSDLYTFNGTISGSGGVTQDGAGNTVLTADNTYAGTTLIAGGGGLYINGDQSAATGLTNVNFGTLGGSGTIGGDVFVDAAGRLAPGGLGTTPGTLTINGNLDLADGSNLDYSFGQAGVVGGAYNDLTVVHGNLTLDGTINVTQAPGGNFGPGIYRVISYDGALTNNGLDTTSSDHIVQTSIANQVNLVNTAGLVLSYWDGPNVGDQNDDAIAGGSGTWRLGGNASWTEADGALNGTFDNGSFAVLAGAGGTVTVDNSFGGIHVAGMQFATGGYAIGGGDIALDGPQAIIRVGDGTLGGAAYMAAIASNLTGAGQLVKTDLGTLVLTGANSYSGGTAISGGTLRVSSDSNLGDAVGALSFDNGATLQNTGAFGSARNVTLNTGGGTFQTDADLTLSGPIGGAGGFTKTGGAALTLTGTSSYAGPTTVAAGGLYVDGDQSAATGLTSVAIGATLGGKGKIGGNVAIADGATLSPGSADGTPGTLAIGGNLTLSGGSILNYSFGQANVAGGALNDLTTVGGNLVLDGTLNVSVSPGGSFGPGIYRVFNYAGTLTNNGLAIGSIPSSNYFVQTSIDHQVNLVNTQGLNLNYWDGDAGPKFDGTVNGGSGTWQSSSGNDNWTEDTGSINAAYSDGAFAIFAGQAGTVTVDNGLGQVSAAGMQFSTDGYVIQGGDIALVGPASTIRVGDSTSAGAGYTATIASALTGNAQLVKTDAGTLVLTGTNSYTGGTAINGGTLRVSADANLGDSAGGLSFNGGTLNTSASFASGRAVDVLGQGTIATDAGTTLTLNGVLSGAGALTKSGGGTLALTADSSGFTGTTAIGGGTVNVSGKLCGTVNVLSGGRLEGTGTVCDTTNAAGGTIAAGNPGVPGTLTVAGNYTGAGGTLEIETVLGDDSSATDRLVVTGNTSGTTTLKVANLGGGGAQTVEGIKIIDVGGISAGTFSLAGDYVFRGDQAVVGGAYAYRLYQNGISTPGDGDWYLRSALINGSPQPLYSPAVPIYEAYPGVLQSLNELGTLQQRVGNRSWTGASQGADEIGSVPTQSAIWARIETAHSRQSPESATTVSDYDVTTWKLQSGFDGLLYEDATGILLGGLTFHYGTASSDISSIYGVGSIRATGYGFGGSLTWYGDNGFYTDGQAEVTWYDSDLKSATLGSDLAKGNNGFGYALSIEAGQKLALQGKWTLTPQAQLSYSSVRFSSFTDPFGAAVSLGRSNVLTGRAGLSLDYEEAWTGAQGKVSRSHLYGIANLYYDFLDGNDVDVSGTAFHEHDQPLWGGLGLGGSLSWADDRYTVFGEAFAKSSLKNFGDSRSIGAKLGFSVKW